MSVGEYAAGVLFFVTTLGCVLGAVEVVRRRRLSHLTGAPRIVAQVLLATCGLALAQLLPGALGILSRSTALTCAAILLVGSLLLPAARAAHPDPAPSDVSPRWSIALAALAGVSVAAVGSGAFLHFVTRPMQAVDLISYDLPVIGRWIQSGTVWPITELFPLQTHGTYPQNAHLVVTAVMLPFHNDALVRLLTYPFLGFAAIATYATARELRAPAATASLFAAMLVAFPTVLANVESAPMDTVAIAIFCAGVLFLIRHVRTGRTSELVLAGLGLGFAAGAKWYFTSAVGLLVILWAGWSLVIGGTERWRWARQVAVMTAVVIAGCGFWLLRNLVEAGDPVYPLRVTIFGTNIFPAPPDVYRAIAGSSIADYLRDPSVLTHYILPALRKALGLPGLVVLGGIVWCVEQAIGHRRRWRRHRRDRVLLFLAMASIVLAILYVVTPYTAFGPKGRPLFAWVNVRYLIPALSLAVPLTAGLVSRAGARVRTVAEIAVLAAVLQGALGGYRLLGIGRTALAAGAVVVVLAAAWAWRWHRSRSYPTGTPTIVGKAVAASAVAVVLVAAYWAQHHLNAHRYAADDATYAWLQAHGQRRKIGLAGSWDFEGVSPAWPSFGKRIGNQVSFAGDLHRGNLTQFHDRAPWLAALRKNGYDLVLISRNAPPSPTSDHELKWAAQAGLPVVARSSRFELVKPP